jgi:hypothetical protein
MARIRLDDHAIDPEMCCMKPEAQRAGHCQPDQMLWDSPSNRSPKE